MSEKSAVKKTGQHWILMIVLYAGSRPYPRRGLGGERGRKAAPGPAASLVWEERQSPRWRPPEGSSLRTMSLKGQRCLAETKEKLQ